MLTYTLIKFSHAAFGHSWVVPAVNLGDVVSLDVLEV